MPYMYVMVLFLRRIMTSAVLAVISLFYLPIGEIVIPKKSVSQKNDACMSLTSAFRI